VDAAIETIHRFDVSTMPPVSPFSIQDGLILTPLVPALHAGLE